MKKKRYKKKVKYNRKYKEVGDLERMPRYLKVENLEDLIEEMR